MTENFFMFYNIFFVLLNDNWDNKLNIITISGVIFSRRLLR